MNASLWHMPLPRLLLPFGLGIILSLSVDKVAPPELYVSVLIVSALILLICPALLTRRFRTCWLMGVSASLILFFLGFFLCQQHRELWRSEHFSHYGGEGDQVLLVQLREPVSEKQNSFQLIVDVFMVYQDSLPRSVGGRLMLYVEKDSLVEKLTYGDRLLIMASYRRLRPPHNPHAFDYRKYLERNNIFHSAYLRSDQWWFTGENHGRQVMRSALHLRGKALETFRENRIGDKEFAIVSALLLGYRENLDEDLRREFAGAGAMHVLCVSGLHVGIIFLVLKTFLAFLLKLPGGLYVRTLCIVLLIWLYAAITGFSPSVLRASVMFSFVAVGQSFKRPTNIYNTLSASAFVLLVSNPLMIAHIGFQLSYLAVLSIVSLQPWIQGLLRVRNKLLNKLWSILTVSVAAQLATGPLALHYFHQFPNYFIVTNLLVIPLASLIIYLALLSMCLAPLPLAGAFSGECLSFALRMMHRSVAFIEGLPYSTTDEVFISFVETLLFLAAAIFLLGYFMKGHRRGLLLGLVLSLALQLSFSVRRLERGKQQDFVVYHSQRMSAVDFFAGPQHVFLSCRQAHADERAVGFAVFSNRLYRGSLQQEGRICLGDSIAVLQESGLARAGPIIHFGEIRLFLLDNDLFAGMDRKQGRSVREVAGPEMEVPMGKSVPGLSVDYLLITQRPSVDVALLMRYIIPGKVLIDTSNPAWWAGRLEKEFLEAGVEVWNVWRMGSYVSQTATGR